MTFERPLPTSLSPSRLADFQSCPRKFQHASIDRIPQPATYATALGRYVHFVLEQIFKLPPASRDAEQVARYLDDATVEIMTESVMSDLGFDDAQLAKFRTEGERIARNYFTMEDPTNRLAIGVEERVNVTIEGVPLVGILDRLDREEDGSLTIVDYKTGRAPNPNYLSATFANTELYAAMWAAHSGELPTRIRLLYIGVGEVVERTVTPVVANARSKAAARAWDSITGYYSDGEFPATPSSSACRFCAFKSTCRANGVAVP